MPRFTAEQYDLAIEHLTLAKKQLEPDGRCCAICGCDGHQAMECGHNPLVAIAICRNIADQAEQLHETLHLLAGYHQAFGVQIGPARVQIPDPEGEAVQVQAMQKRLADAGDRRDWKACDEIEGKYEP